MPIMGMSITREPGASALAGGDSSDEEGPGWPGVYSSLCAGNQFLFWVISKKGKKKKDRGEKLTAGIKIQTWSLSAQS